MMPTSSDIGPVLHGSFIVLALVLVLGGNAVALDLIVKWLKRRGVSHGLCNLLECATLLIAMIELALVVTTAGAHAWEHRPSLFHSKAPDARPTSIHDRVERAASPKRHL